MKTVSVPFQMNHFDVISFVILALLDVIAELLRLEVLGRVS